MRIGPVNISFYNPRKHKGWMPQIDGTPAAVLPFASADLDACILMMASRLSNVKFSASADYIALRRIFGEFQASWFRMLKALISDGFVVFDCRNLRLCENAGADTVTIVDGYYRQQNVTQADAMRPYLSMLDTVVNADLNLTKNYGALGILSPSNSGLADGFIDDEERERMMEEYNSTYGTTFGKWSLLVTRQDVKFQPISLPVAALQLTEKRRNALSSVLQFLNIPKELHASFENAKYANRQEAERDIYSNCIKSWATFFAAAAGDIFAKYAQLHPEARYPARRPEIWFDFDGVPALASAAAEDRKRALDELTFWRQVAQDDDEEIRATARKRIKDLTEIL